MQWVIFTAIRLVTLVELLIIAFLVYLVRIEFEFTPIFIVFGVVLILIAEVGIIDFSFGISQQVEDKENEERERQR